MSKKRCIECGEKPGSTEGVELWRLRALALVTITAGCPGVRLLSRDSRIAKCNCHCRECKEGFVDAILKCKDKEALKGLGK